MLYVYDRETQDSVGEFKTRGQMKKFLRSNRINPLNVVVKTAPVAEKEDDRWRSPPVEEVEEEKSMFGKLFS